MFIECLSMLSLSLLATFMFVFQIHSYVIQDKYNIQLKDSVRYKIEQNVGDSDYEMIKREQLEEFNINVKEKRELNKLASRKYEDMSKGNKGSFKGTNWLTAVVQFKKTESHNNNTTAISPLVSSVIHDLYEFLTVRLLSFVTQHVTREKETSKTQTEELYDYNKLLSEYYEESMAEASSNDTYKPRSDFSESGLIYTLKKLVSFESQTVNCKQSSEIGLKAVICLWNEYKAHTVSSRALALRFWKIVKAWLFVYLAVAMPLWCTRGWCCCCLYCKFFKPYQTIDEAKNYLLSNPPGILHTRKGKKFEYEPSEREKERYEEFEHLLKTI